jgi:hypothetical protein
MADSHASFVCLTVGYNFPFGVSGAALLFHICFGSFRSVTHSLPGHDGGVGGSYRFVILRREGDVILWWKEDVNQGRRTVLYHFFIIPVLCLRR